METKELRRVLEALEASTGIQGILVDEPHTGGSTSVALMWRDTERRVAFVWKPSIQQPSIGAVVDWARSQTAPLVLATPYLAPALAQRLREEGVFFADQAGNAYLDLEPGMVYVVGRKPAREGPRARRISISHWKVAFVLLRQPHSDRTTVRELASLSGASVGSTSAALRAFEERGWLRRGRRTLRLRDASQLLAHWEVAWLDALAPKLSRGHARPLAASDVSAWAASVVDQCEPRLALLGGEAGAEVLGAPIRASTATLHLAQWSREVLLSMRLVPAEHGPIRLLDQFGEANSAPSDHRLADPILVRGELLGIRDERLDEARTWLRQHIESRWEES